MASNKIHIIGIGDDGLDGITAQAKGLIDQADLLLGAESTLKLVPPSTAERAIIGVNLDDAVQQISAAAGKRVVVLATGDPLFYGVARFLCDKLGKERFDVVPHVSTMQMAFARVKESWEDAYLTNLATNPLDGVVEKIRVADTVGLFTSDLVSPADVAQALVESGIDYFRAYVCEHLGSPDERVTQGSLNEIAHEEFGPLNVMILVRRPETPDRPTDAHVARRFGNPDEMFLQSRPKRGLLTPAEVRTIALAEMAIGPASIVWDIGAGSGSVSIEAAMLAEKGTVYAVEMDGEDINLIRSNADRFHVKNLIPILGRAPEAWGNLPQPDCIFVGGSGREIARVVELAFKQLKPGGRMVANVASIESLSSLDDSLNRLAGDVKVLMINVARGTHQLERVRFGALNPSFLLSAVKAR
ncbi:MAG: precorrin-6y C5,15-methyltransferase (decarboxylating) subunit CbiE [Pirellulales bacterium]|nr:precorrin-6y C5,15-methyltransferase (decarboxylating) subunit CbiE [Pirellulales bacterium]